MPNGTNSLFFGAELAEQLHKFVLRGGQLASPSGGAPSKAEKPSGGKKKVGWLKNIKSVAISFIQDKDSSGNSKSTPSTTTSSAADATSSSSSSASSSERLKAHQSGKSCKELTGLYMCQEIMAHEGSIWSIKFSTNGRWLASAGKDHVVTRPIKFKFNPLDPFGLDDVNKAGPGGEKGKERKGKQSMTVVSTAGSTA
ncbi:hypothetical protein OsJ_25670 [Oryza sativa Japonica Group]|uniref:Uncharacterized protein n=1 Tax=Oryza sativa subsp. japonica TaxID=39947 RepID=B9FV03_ORYSJ|nr:hypothetical protein OsJ_25670 [Oryza sativa Japonica Group]